MGKNIFSLKIGKYRAKVHEIDSFLYILFPFCIVVDSKLETNNQNKIKLKIMFLFLIPVKKAIKYTNTSNKLGREILHKLNTVTERMKQNKMPIICLIIN